MGTVFSVALARVPDGSVIRAVESELDRIDRVFPAYRGDSDISTLADGRKRLRDCSPDGPVHAAPSAESAVLDADQRRSLADAIDRLPDKARLVVTCRYLLELSESETAQVLGWPVGTVKSRLSRALDGLRLALTASRALEEGER